MDRFNITKRIGENFVTSNIEGGEFSYVQAAGSKSTLMKALPNNQVKHFKYLFFAGIPAYIRARPGT